MKLAIFFICLLMCGCDRESLPPVGDSKEKAPSRVSHPTAFRSPTITPQNSPASAAIDESAWEAIKEASRPETSRAGMTKLRAMADSLAKQNKLAQTIALLGAPKSGELSDLVRAVFEAKRAKHEYDLEYLAALKVLNDSPQHPRAEELIEDIERVPRYVFPTETPNAWDAANAAHLHKGYPGLLALALVSRTDSHTQSLYHQKLASASDDLKIVMLWALGHAPRREAFDYLLSLHSTSAVSNKALIVRSLNRIPLAIEEAAIASNDPVQKESLTALRAELLKYLIDKKLSVELTTWD